MSLRSHVYLFSKTQVAAAAATLIDFLFVVLFVEAMKFHYLISVALGALLGGLSNFTINRLWTFQSDSNVLSEMKKYFTVWSGSLTLNVSLVWIFTEAFNLKYFVSKALVVLLVALFWNYPLHRFWVFVKSSGE